MITFKSFNLSFLDHNSHEKVIQLQLPPLDVARLATCNRSVVSRTTIAWIQNVVCDLASDVSPQSSSKGFDLMAIFTESSRWSQALQWLSSDTQETKSCCGEDMEVCNPAQQTGAEHEVMFIDNIPFQVLYIYIPVYIIYISLSAGQWLAACLTSLVGNCVMISWLCSLLVMKPQQLCWHGQQP